MYLQIHTYMKTVIPILMDLSSASLKSMAGIWTLKASRMSFKSGSSTSIKRYVLSREFAHVGVWFLGLASKFTGKDPLLSEFNIYMLNRNNEYDCSKAERELGFHCRPFSESIRDTVAWLREEEFLSAA